MRMLQLTNRSTDRPVYVDFEKIVMVNDIESTTTILHMVGGHTIRIAESAREILELIQKRSV